MIHFYIKTYGCQANVADSEGLMRYLAELGCRQVDSVRTADLIIINTCAIRDKAERKLYSYIGELAILKKDRPYLKIGIIGCVASYRKKELYTSFDHLNFVYGARDDMPTLQAYLTDLIVNLEMIKQLCMQGKEYHWLLGQQDRDIKLIVERKNLLQKIAIVQAASISQFNLKKHLDAADKGGSTKNSYEIKRSFINIMTGCNKYCAYCIVPFTRGKEVSYSMHDILGAVKKDVFAGAKEVTLIGQNVNSYIDPETGARFSDLLRRVAEIDGDFWVRFISPHPQDITKDLFEVMQAYRPKVTAFLHFPLQSGSDRILALMNRNYTVAEYLNKVDLARQYLPGVALTTDIIVGFPGETNEDYLATREVMEQVRYDLIYSFIYSSRKYTKAASMHDTCTLAEKNRRLAALQERQTVIAVEQNLLLKGKVLKVLVEKRLAHGKLLARTEGNIRVFLDGEHTLVGSFVDVKIQETAVAHISGCLATVP